MKYRNLFGVIFTCLILWTTTVSADNKGFQGGRLNFMIDKLFDRYDENQDGQITLEERTNVESKRFQQADSDQDGYLNESEIISLREQRRGPRQGHQRDPMTQLDQNTDGLVSAQEFIERGNPILARADADEDGVLTREEVQSMMMRIRELKDRNQPQ